MEAQAPALVRPGVAVFVCSLPMPFPAQGSVSTHMETVKKLHESITEQRVEIEQAIVQLGYFDELSTYAEHTQQTCIRVRWNHQSSAFRSAVVFRLHRFWLRLIGVNIAKGIRRPSKLVQGALDQVANKDLATQVPAYQANKWIRFSERQGPTWWSVGLTHVIENMRQSSLHLKEASLDNQSTSGSLREAMMLDQTNQTVMVAAAMEQIECSVTEITQAANRNTDTGMTSAVAVQRRATNHGQGIDLMGVLESKLAESASTIDKLEKRVPAFSSILDVISVFQNKLTCWH